MNGTTMSDERRQIDHVDHAVGVTSEAAELAEHIRDTGPRYRRKELMDQLVTMIDDAHESALSATVRLGE